MKHSGICCITVWHQSICSDTPLDKFPETEKYGSYYFLPCGIMHVLHGFIQEGDLARLPGHTSLIYAPVNNW